MAPYKKKGRRNPLVKLTEKEQLAQEKKEKQAKQKQAIIMFTSGILLLAVEFIPGKGLWLWLKSLLFGMFGLSAVLLPIALIYIAIVIAFDKLEGDPRDKIWQIAVFVLLICGLSEVLSSDPYAGANLWEKIKILYIGGSTYSTGGIFSTVIGWPLLALCGETGAVIIMLLFLFAFFMILTNSTLVGFFTGVKKSANTVGGIYSAVNDTRRNKKLDRLQQEQAEYERLVNLENSKGNHEPITNNNQAELEYLQQIQYDEDYFANYEEDDYEYTSNYEEEYKNQYSRTTLDFSSDLEEAFNNIPTQVNKEPQTPLHAQQPQQVPPQQTPLHTQQQTPLHAQSQQKKSPPSPPRRTVEELLELERRRTARNSKKYDDYSYTENKSIKHIEVLSVVEDIEKEEAEKADAEFERIVKYGQIDELEQPINIVNDAWRESKERELELEQELEKEASENVSYHQRLINELSGDDSKETKVETKVEDTHVVKSKNFNQSLSDLMPKDEKEFENATKPSPNTLVEEDNIADKDDYIAKSKKINQPLSDLTPKDEKEFENATKPSSNTLVEEDNTEDNGDYIAKSKNFNQSLSDLMPKDEKEFENATKPLPDAFVSKTPVSEALVEEKVVDDVEVLKDDYVDKSKNFNKSLSDLLPKDEKEFENTTKPLYDTLVEDDVFDKSKNFNQPLANTLTKEDAEPKNVNYPLSTKLSNEKEETSPKTKSFVQPLASTLPNTDTESQSKKEELDIPRFNTQKTKEKFQNIAEKEPARPTPTPKKPRYTSQVAETVNDDYSANLLQEQEVARVDPRVQEFEKESGQQSNYDDYMYYDYPPTSLLKSASKNSSRNSYEELQEIGDLLIDTLASFKVQATMLDISKGPSVTRYEIKPATGVKISKIMGLGDDIALNLSASGVRVAPIPEKSAVGIEVPNQTTDLVTMREIIESDDFDHADSNLAIALGKDITGKNIIGNIATMPHMLIAGSTGAGKSVCINSIIMSILYKASPEDVRLLMIDPKVVELGIYNGIPHLLVPVVTDPRKAAGALSWAVKEMLKRYELLAENNVRDIKGYNALEGDHITPMPQIVIIIDELADLMMAASKEVEDSICRLAQMARAAGMHLIIATQRPSVDVITGLIKANVPSRIAFAVSSQIDSRTILDTAGAEKLLGKGDMLFSPIGVNKPIRIQGCFVSDDEINKVVNFIKAESSAEYDEQIIQEIENQSIEKGSKGDKNSGGGFDDTDELLEDAIEIVVDAGKASTSSLQRKLRVGYARAARIIDEMEERGIVTPADGSKPRQVLISKQQWYEMKLNSSN